MEKTHKLKDLTVGTFSKIPRPFSHVSASPGKLKFFFSLTLQRKGKNKGKSNRYFTKGRRTYDPLQVETKNNQYGKRNYRNGKINFLLC